MLFACAMSVHDHYACRRGHTARKSVKALCGPRMRLPPRLADILALSDDCCRRTEYRWWTESGCRDKVQNLRFREERQTRCGGSAFQLDFLFGRTIHVHHMHMCHELMLSCVLCIINIVHYLRAFPTYTSPSQQAISRRNANTKPLGIYPGVLPPSYVRFPFSFQHTKRITKISGNPPARHRI